MQDNIHEVRNTRQPKEKKNQKPKDNKETATSSNQPTTPPPKVTKIDTCQHDELYSNAPM
jgi:hypothetical protein